MSCKRARGLFSARIDDELTPVEAGSLEMHLRDCTEGCREQWNSFQVTVRMVHALPPVEPDPSFVGQVLDRVRAWEAQEAGRTVSVPVRVPWSTSQRGSGFGERLRGWFKIGDPISLSEWLDGLRGGLAGSRALVPVRVAFAVVLGVGGGLAIGHQAFLSNRAGSVPGLAARSLVSAPTVPGDGSGRIRTTTNAARPFGDLAGDIPPVRAARGGVDSVSVQPDDIGVDPATYPGGLDSRQVLTTPGDARPHVTTNDGRPQHIF